MGLAGPGELESASAAKPWVAAGVSRRTWYYRRAKAKDRRSPDLDLFGVRPEAEPDVGSGPLVQRLTRWLEHLPVTAGLLAGNRFKVWPWQRQILRGLYGHHRRVRNAVISVARKNGKTGFVAGLATASLAGPLTEEGGEILLAASDRNQASHMFRAVQRIIEKTPWLRRTCNIQRAAKTIEHLPTGSLLKTISADAGRQHGHNANLIVCDEVAQWDRRQSVAGRGGAGRDLYEVLSTSSGARQHPLLVVISTQSANPLSLMSELVDYALSVDGEQDPQFYGFVRSADIDQDPWSKEAWVQANPGLGTIRSLEELEAWASQARKIPARVAAFRNLYLNQRIEADASFLPVAAWLECQGDPDFRGPCYVGMDLASVSDMASIACYWPDTGAVQAWGWIGRQTLAHDGRLPLQAWRDDGLLFCDGETISKIKMAQFLSDLIARYDIAGVAFDRWGIDGFRQTADAAGVYLPEMEPFGQGFRDMGPATNALETLILDKALVHDNPILTWQLQNIQVDEDPAGNRKFTKTRSRDKIDAMIALVMAVGLAARRGATRYDFQDAVLTL